MSRNSVDVHAIHENNATVKMWEGLGDGNRRDKISAKPEALFTGKAMSVVGSQDA